MTSLNEAPFFSLQKPVLRYRGFARNPAVAILAVVVAAAVLLLFPPAQYSFYPQCPIHQYLGILCPGCGSTRALAALLHGQLREALRLNLLTTLAIPLAFLWKLVCRKPLRLIQPRRWAVWMTFTVIAAFTVMRNL
ncbi:MAG TPA: DUF2752 domain-containing protein [Edaphobacter sp.]|nr:DUF2752 domain-containing protein [Edaphobacter sp.]